ncbi:hypothetical protein HG535_0E00460 [Zygotorulaspora mrakii]|uniref:Uncharacterized protein n=1 Tax=Zygotorulaspora mrakii TaxID=42260 RepID=A0A7H9B5B5_ZYGMR|nr:uncharacterized protein HG535_0E00460 [Zygotorulaspora mrakii]QLG72962.1 hypothetical protein HG535_0E00460 [Zygotorulaspora mrakii]
MESLIARANRGNFAGVEKKQYWKYDWYTPSRIDATTSNTNSNAEIARSSESGSTDKLPVKYKTWSKTDKSIFVDYHDDDIGDLFDLSMHSGIAHVVAGNSTGAKVPNGGTMDEGLTMEDIRGAVGDSEAIPGLSSSDTIKKNQEVETPTVQESSIAPEGNDLPLTDGAAPEIKCTSNDPQTNEIPATSKVDDKPKDIDGDVNMQLE